jgi:hypothetical protein
MALQKTYMAINAVKEALEKEYTTDLELERATARLSAMEQIRKDTDEHLRVLESILIYRDIDDVRGPGNMTGEEKNQRLRANQKSAAGVLQSLNFAIHHPEKSAADIQRLGILPVNVDAGSVILVARAARIAKKFQDEGTHLTEAIYELEGAA